MRTLALAALLTLTAASCAYSDHAARPATLGTARSSDDLVALLDTPGPVTLETVASCDWQVDRSGLINLEHPTAKAAHLEDGPEAIQVFFHVIRHPTKGTFLVDTGVEKALRDAPDQAAMRGLVASVMHVDQMTFHVPLDDFLAKEATPPAGVFLTHLHLDHVSGMPDVPNATPLYAGPGETRGHSLTNLVVQPNIDRALAGKDALNEWPFAGDAGGRFAGVVDIFGDGSVWALSVPGHTEGSTAYLVRTTTGPVLLTGDASHTRWGWEHDVEPGTFSGDKPKSAESLAMLRTFVAAHPAIEVRLGHQR
jgi:glyoxylase-like metal-dependent hydrolase (beta-lactamase superfamily II)